MERHQIGKSAEAVPSKKPFQESVENLPEDISFDAKKNGESVGSITLYVGKSPYPYYYIASLTVSDSERGSGYGSELMEKAEAHIRKSGVTGLLVDDIDTKSPAYGMYRRRGWKLVPGTEDTYYFNLQKNQDPTLLRNTF